MADAAAAPTSSANHYYPTQSFDNPRSRRELPNEAFKLLAKIPSPFPYIYRFIVYTFHVFVSIFIALSPLIIVPLKALWHLLVVIFTPVVTLLEALNYYLVLIPFGIAMSIGKALYPLYVFGMVAVLLGGAVGAFGGWLNWVTSPQIGKVGTEVKGEIHREITQLVDGKAGVRREQRMRDDKGKGRRREGANEEEYDLQSRRASGMTRGKQEELQDWRDTVWY
ncbi:hypothetical protein M408DRAFT_331620, partial [Serendipita vermifera MAFF 305830]